MIPLFLLVSKDEYRLPLAVADSIEELAELTGRSYSTLKTEFSRLRHGKASPKCKYEVVWVEDD